MENDEEKKILTDLTIPRQLVGDRLEKSMDILAKDMDGFRIEIRQKARIAIQRLTEVVEDPNMDGPPREALIALQALLSLNVRLTQVREVMDVMHTAAADVFDTLTNWEHSEIPKPDPGIDPGFNSEEDFIAQLDVERAERRRELLEDKTEPHDPLLDDIPF